MTQSTQPNRSNGYQVGLQTKFTPEFWRQTIGDLHLRLAELEGIKVSFEAIENAGINAALKRIEVVIGPAIEAANALLEEAEGKVDEMEAARQAAETVLAELQAAGLEAANVELAAIEGFDAGDVQAAVSELLADLSALSDALAAATTAQTQALAAEVTARTEAIASVQTSYATFVKFQ